MSNIFAEEFDYELPSHLIARAPLEQRDASRLLCVGDDLAECRFDALGELLRPGDLLVFNNTQVVKARLRGTKQTGGRAEVLLERVESECVALCMLRVSKPLQPGQLILAGGYRLECLGRAGQFYRLRFSAPVLEVLERAGEVPLPPYLQATPGALDEQRYQTVYAQIPGAVAAPTAGLHFTEALLDKLREQAVCTTEITLHVGAGTFQPVRGAVEDHVMHSERYQIDAAAAEAIQAARLAGKRVVAVGTTVVRTLEAQALACGGQLVAGSGDTRLFIRPGYEFQVVDALLTNFHLPRSTLLMLVSAFAGTAAIERAYAHAVAAEFRFFSYGDAMFLTRANDNV